MFGVGFADDHQCPLIANRDGGNDRVDCVLLCEIY
jgi:hypothetical protein